MDENHVKSRTSFCFSCRMPSLWKGRAERGIRYARVSALALMLGLALFPREGFGAVIEKKTVTLEFDGLGSSECPSGASECIIKTLEIKPVNNPSGDAAQTTFTSTIGLTSPPTGPIPHIENIWIGNNNFVFVTQGGTNSFDLTGTKITFDLATYNSDMSKAYITAHLGGFTMTGAEFYVDRSGYGSMGVWAGGIGNNGFTLFDNYGGSMADIAASNFDRTFSYNSGNRIYYSKFIFDDLTTKSKLNIYNWGLHINDDYNEDITRSTDSTRDDKNIELVVNGNMSGDINFTNHGAGMNLWLGRFSGSSLKIDDSGVTGGAGGDKKTSAYIGALDASGHNMNVELKDTEAGGVFFKEMIIGGGKELSIGGTGEYDFDTLHAIDPGARFVGDLDATNGHTLSFDLTRSDGTTPMLTVNGNADIIGSNLVLINNGKAITLELGQRFMLIKTDGGRIDWEGNGDARWRPVPPGRAKSPFRFPGVLFDYNFMFDVDDHTNPTEFFATFDGKSLRPNDAKTFSEGAAAGLAAVSQGANMIGNKAMSAAALAARYADGEAAFGAIQYGNSTYQTGSSVDAGGLALVAGYARGKLFEHVGHGTVGVFGELGLGSYKTKNDNEDGDEVKGSGSANYFGIGGLGRFENFDRWYAEASLRFGLLKNSFTSGLTDSSGDGAKMEMDHTYVGFGWGFGKIWRTSEVGEIDVFFKNYMTMLSSEEAEISTDESISYASMKASEMRLGGRYYRDLDRPFLNGEMPARWYTGLSLISISGGDAPGSAIGCSAAGADCSIPVPSISGTSTMVEAGLEGRYGERWSGSAGLGLYFGDRQGYELVLRAKYEISRGERIPTPEEHNAWIEEEKAKEAARKAAEAAAEAAAVAAAARARARAAPEGSIFVQPITELEFVEHDRTRARKSCVPRMDIRRLTPAERANLKIDIVYNSASPDIADCAAERAWEVSSRLKKRGLSEGNITIRKGKVGSGQATACGECSADVKYDADGKGWVTIDVK